MKRTKNLKITPKTHEILKNYCEEQGLKMFAFVEKLIKISVHLKKIYMVKLNSNITHLHTNTKTSVVLGV